MKCKNCHVNIADGLEKGPLWRKFVGKSAARLLGYPSYKEIEDKVSRHILRKLLLFLSIVGGVVSVFINIFTFSEQPMLWSLIVVVAWFALWLSVVVLSSKQINAAGKAIDMYGIISVLMVVVDSCTGFNKWSTTYVIPFLSIGLTLLITIITITKKSRFIEYFGYLLTTFFVSLTPLILIIFPLSNTIWTSLVSIVYSLLTTVGLIIFSDKDFKAEIKKRFHL